jgi:histidyl-tRNA synthetase
MRAGRVTVKDLAAGKAAASAIENRNQWVEERPGQFDIDRAHLIAKLKELSA